MTIQYKVPRTKELLFPKKNNQKEFIVPAPPEESQLVAGETPIHFLTDLSKQLKEKDAYKRSFLIDIVRKILMQSASAQGRTLYIPTPTESDSDSTSEEANHVAQTDPAAEMTLFIKNHGLSALWKVMPTLRGFADIFNIPSIITAYIVTFLLEVPLKFIATLLSVPVRWASKLLRGYKTFDEWTGLNIVKNIGKLLFIVPAVPVAALWCAAQTLYLIGNLLNSAWLALDGLCNILTSLFSYITKGLGDKNQYADLRDATTCFVKHTGYLLAAATVATMFFIPIVGQIAAGIAAIIGISYGIKKYLDYRAQIKGTSNLKDNEGRIRLGKSLMQFAQDNAGYILGVAAVIMVGVFAIPIVGQLIAGVTALAVGATVGWGTVAAVATSIGITGLIAGVMQYVLGAYERFSNWAITKVLADDPNAPRRDSNSGLKSLLNSVAASDRKTTEKLSAEHRKKQGEHQKQVKSDLETKHEEKNSPPSTVTEPTNADGQNKPNLTVDVDAANAASSTHAPLTDKGELRGPALNSASSQSSTLKENTEVNTATSLPAPAEGPKSSPLHPPLEKDHADHAPLKEGHEGTLFQHSENHSDKTIKSAASSAPAPKTPTASK